jgi:hypothetical protein
MLIDIDALRAALLDLCGTATFAGYGPALVDVADIEAADPAELLAIAERLGVDPRDYEVR